MTNAPHLLSRPATTRILHIVHRCLALARMFHSERAGIAYPAAPQAGNPAPQSLPGRWPDAESLLAARAAAIQLEDTTKPSGDQNLRSA